jgi:signal transduction histidine kinase
MARSGYATGLTPHSFQQLWTSLTNAWLFITYTMPSDTPGLQMRRRILQAYISICIAVGMLLLANALRMQDWQGGAALLWSLPGAIVSWWLNRSGSQLGSWLMIVVVILGVVIGYPTHTLVDASAGRTEIYVPLLYGAPLILAGLCLRPYQVLGVVATLYGAVTIALSLTGVAPGPIANFIVIAILDSLLLIAPCVFLISHLEQSLVAERDVRTQLEDRVAERTQQLRQANAELAQADAQKARWLIARRDRTTEIVHDLKTDIAGIQAVSETMLMDLEDAGVDAEVRDEHSTMLRLNMQAMLAKVQTMLTASSLQAEQLPLHFTPTDLGAVARQVHTRQTLVCQQRGVTLHLVIPRDAHLVVECDVIHAERIVLNLVDNAMKFIKASQATPAITIRVETLPESLAIRVIDNGPGIADVEAVKQRWARAATNVEGTGLGLSFCDALARQMGGRLDIESTIGQGTTASLILPAFHEDGKSP